MVLNLQSIDIITTPLIRGVILCRISYYHNVDVGFPFKYHSFILNSKASPLMIWKLKFYPKYKLLEGSSYQCDKLPFKNSELGLLNPCHRHLVINVTSCLLPVRGHYLWNAQRRWDTLKGTSSFDHKMSFPLERGRTSGSAWCHPMPPEFRNSNKIRSYLVKKPCWRGNYPADGLFSIRVHG